MDELAGVLSREQLLLGRLVFKLVELRGLLAAGEARFLPWAAEEVDQATARLKEAELHRALVVNRVAAAAGRTDEELSLRALAESTPGPYAAIFASQRVAMLALTVELRECVHQCRVSAGDGESLVTGVLERVERETVLEPVDREAGLGRLDGGVPARAMPLVVTW